MENRYAFNKNKHVHTLDSRALFGTTTLINQMMPPPLQWWASGKALEMFGWTNNNFKNENYVPSDKGIAYAEAELKKISKMEPDEYYNFLQKCYRNHDVFKSEAGSWGTEKHHAIETIIKEAIIDNGGLLKESEYEDEAADRFAKWGRGKKFIHSEVCVFSEKFWLGGVIDNIYEENGKYYIGDVKTSKSGLKPSQFFQLGLYDIQQKENGFYSANGNKVGDPLEISGYTIIPIPKEIKTKKVFVPMTWTDTEPLTDFGKMLVAGYKLKNELESFC